MKRRQFSFHFALPQPEFHFDWRGWLPSRGNVLFTLVMIAVLIWAQSAGAMPTRAESAASTGTIAYQGRLADSAGNPLTSTLNMSFRLYSAASGGTPLWSEQWTGSNGVKVSDGLFNVMLGSLTPIPQSVITGNANLFLGITVGTDDEMVPRVQLGSVPFAVQALTVPDGSITVAKLAPDVSLVPPDGSVTTAKIADGAVTPAKLNLNNDVRLASDKRLWLRNDQTAYSAGYFIHTALNAGNAPIRVVGTGDIATPRYVEFGYYSDETPTWARKAYIDTTNGNAYFAGILQVAGTKSAVVSTVNHGQRKLYAVEAPDVRFSDEGMAHLQSGQARVELDPVFLETIEDDYLIQITPYGDASLYVAEIGADYFVVKAREGDPNVTFTWRLSATRKGYAGVRLEEVKGLDHEVAK